MMRKIAVDFSFAADPGEKPEMAWLAIDDLVINDDYQRPLAHDSLGQIRRIAKNFAWERFAPVFVAVEGDGFAIIDGQHRVHAARACGIEKVPCLIVRIDHRAQARAFAAINGNIIKVSPLQVFHARCAAGEVKALELKQLVESCHFRIMRSNASTRNKKFGEIFAIVTIERIVRMYGHDVLAAVLLTLHLAENCTSHKDCCPAILSALAQLFFENRAICATPLLVAERFEEGMSAADFYEEAFDQAQQKRRRGIQTTAKDQLVMILRREIFREGGW